MSSVAAKPIRAAIYCRVSTEQQSKDDKFSLKTQEDECRRRATVEGWTVVERFVIPEVVSGYKPIRERPGLARLLDALVAGEIDALVIHDPDRLSRRQVVLGTILDRVERAEKARGSDRPAPPFRDRRLRPGRDGNVRPASAGVRRRVAARAHTGGDAARSAGEGGERQTDRYRPRSLRSALSRRPQ